MADVQLNRSQLVAFSMGFVVIGLLISVSGLLMLQSALATKNWPTVEGVVLSSSLETITAGNKSSFKPEVVYKYTVNGKQYTRNRPGLDDGVSNQTTGPMESVQRYKSGQNVSVYYNPKDPQVSVLEHGAPVFHYVLIVAGVVFLGFGVVVYLCRNYGQ